MLKLLFTGLMIYLLYRYFFGANALGSGEKENRWKFIRRKEPSQARGREEDDDEEYIDYEEVD